MRPAAIPESAVRRRPWAKAIAIGPPPGVSGDDCGTVTALIEDGAYPEPFPTRIRIPLELEAGDLERLQAGELVWLTVFSSVLQPFAVDLDPPTALVAQHAQRD